MWQVLRQHEPAYQGKTILFFLSEFGADAKVAVPRVVEFLGSPRLYLRGAATNALPKIDPETAAGAGVK
jgi:hypothetical protein